MIASFSVARALAANQLYLGAHGRPRTTQQAVFLLGTRGKIVYSTEAAQDLINEVGRSLYLPDHSLDLGAMLGAAALDGNLGTKPRPFRIGRGPDKLPLFALAIALEREEGAGEAAIPRTILIVCDPEKRTPFVAEMIQQTWELTVAEARVAAQISLGRGIDEVADRLNVTRETVRTHLKRIFAKTGTSSQAELVAFISAVQSIHFPF